MGFAIAMIVLALLRTLQLTIKVARQGHLHRITFRD